MIDTDPGYDLKQFDVRGRSYLLNVGATHPIIRSRTENLYGRLNFDYAVKSSNDIEETRRDRLSVLRAGARYEFIDTLAGAAANTVDVELSKGLNILGASDEGDDNMTRDAADPQATKLKRTSSVCSASPTTSTFLLARGVRLPPTLCFLPKNSAGGVYGFGAVYDPSEVTGDHGIAGKVELQWNDPYKLDPDYVDRTSCTASTISAASGTKMRRRTLRSATSRRLAPAFVSTCHMKWIAGASVVQEPAGAFGGDDAQRREQFVGVLVLKRHACGQEAVVGEGLESGGKAVVPAERSESHVRNTEKLAEWAERNERAERSRRHRRADTKKAAPAGGRKSFEANARVSRTRSGQPAKAKRT